MQRLILAAVILGWMAVFAGMGTDAVICLHDGGEPHYAPPSRQGLFRVQCDPVDAAPDR